MTTKGENTSVHFSTSTNKLVFVRDFPHEHKTPQIVEKDLVTKTERRVTHNLGVNKHPRYHPQKPWIIYSSSADEIIENLNLNPTLTEFGLNTKNIPEAYEPLELYIESQKSSESKRLTKDRGYDGMPAITNDGKTLYYVRRENGKSTIVELNLVTGKKANYHSENNIIQSLSASEQFIAWTTLTKDGKQKLIIKKRGKNETVFLGSDDLSYSDVELHPTQHRFLVITNIEDRKNKDVYQIDLGEKCATRFSFHKADESSPAFGPEGRSLFFVSNRSQVNQIYSTLIRPELPCKPL